MPQQGLFERRGRADYLIARPFSGSHERMYHYFGKGFELDYPKLYQWLKNEEDSREKEVLLFQLENCKL